MVRVFAAGVFLRSTSGSEVPKLQGSNMIGESHDLTKTNLWTMENMYGIDLFSNMPDSCIQEAPCQHGLQITSRTFDSTGNWEKHFASSFGLHARASYMGIGGSISSSCGKSFHDTGFSERNFFHHKVSNRKACYELTNECLSNPDYLTPSIKAALGRMDLNTTDSEALHKWSKYFIRLYGSHAIIATSHGASVQSLSSQDSTCHTSSDCLKQKMCAKLGYTKASDALDVSARVCGKKDACDKMDKCKDLFTETCAVRGGDVNSKAEICEPKVSKELLQEFLESGDLLEGNSAIGYTFMPMSLILTYMGLFKEAEALEQATEFHGCEATPLHEWTSSANGKGSCKCALKCENGGVLDEDACVCKCQGDMYHGFKGDTCSEKYGACQPGAGTHYQSHAVKCAQSNFCASHSWKQQCDVTEVCCLTRIKGACCPYGSACDCDGDDCKCLMKPAYVV